MDPLVVPDSLALSTIVVEHRTELGGVSSQSLHSIMLIFASWILDLGAI